MKVLHVIPSLSPSQGGPSFALPLIARSLVEAGVEVAVASTDDDGPGRRVNVPAEIPVMRDGVNCWLFAKQTDFYKVSLPLSRWLKRHVLDYDLVHIHALFSYPSIAAAHAARRAGVPYIIRPLGVLNRWGMRHRRRWLKALSFRLVERPSLRSAAAMHYTSGAEQVEAEHAGATALPAVVPLGIDVKQFSPLPSAEKFFAKFPEARGRDIVLFLSRVDAKKGLDLLLPALGMVRERFPNCLLVIAGDGEAAYVSSLRAQAAQLGIVDHVVWAGFLAGAEKLSAFAAATVFTLPSYSENFGIALVEALAAGLPCVTTEGVAVSVDVKECGAGVVVPCDAKALAAALREVLGDAALRVRLGANARRLAVERFSLAAMGQRLVRLYTSVIASHSGKKPSLCAGA